MDGYHRFDFLECESFKTSVSRFGTNVPFHSHMLVCRSCFKVVESDDCDLSVLEKLIATKTGFTVEGHHLEFFGLCPECS